MQIVIDKENLIKMFAVALYAISGGSYDIAKDTVTELLEEIGYTSLPKGYGRLGDLDLLEKEMINGIKASNYEDGYDDYSHINNVDDCVECVRYADTIIEADKESEDI